ncbi:SidA/IucD/PvdA family monooxygenase [Chryseobacterium glaciei]|uniref:SidA/IucD/PvdA family monooxygenase n=1 Tax=Chryseobacterium glaciei TaxID=1685010 RepID=UPI001E28849A|nr:SidA/IucD/PvdA family monooxygenase [Chryseobacterium glaciei]
MEVLDLKNNDVTKYFTKKLALGTGTQPRVDHFYNMPASQRQNLLAKQPPLYKGINFELINDIFDTMYEMCLYM